MPQVAQWVNRSRANWTFHLLHFLPSFLTLARLHMSGLVGDPGLTLRTLLTLPQVRLHVLLNPSLTSLTLAFAFGLGFGNFLLGF